MNIPFIDFEYLKGKIEREKPSIVGLSACTETYLNALRIAKIVKEVNPEIVTVIGGPHVTFLPIEALENKELDIVVRNEGEVTMLELVNHFIRGAPSIRGIQGISYRVGGKVHSSIDRPFISDLDGLPFPARRLFPLSFYQSPGSISSARGCLHQCIFCAAGAMSGGKYRIRTPEGIIGEIRHIRKECGLQSFTFVDDTFTISRSRIHKICKLIKSLGFDIEWQCSTRADTLTGTMLKDMRSAGCYAITLGIESGCQRILDEIRKGINLGQAGKAVRDALKVGIKVFCSFMMPHPGDTIATVRQTREFAKGLAQLGAGVTLAFTVPLPGTYLYNNAKALGINILSNDWDDFVTAKPFISTKYLTVNQIENLYKELASEGHMPRRQSKPPIRQKRGRGIRTHDPLVIPP
ncbi:unnamed protein product [marine sediment metagenome]|uniref:Uncharacterized protein n=1 Tax=marine sediment metagenome TaxID=412755 RepID=X1RX29_9ZZZZ